LLNGKRAVRVFWAVSGYAMALIVDDEKRTALNALNRFPRLVLPVICLVLIAAAVEMVVKAVMGRNVELIFHMSKLYNIPKYYLKGGRVNVNTFGQMWTMHVQLYGSWCLYACHSLFKNTVHPSRVVAILAVLSACVNPKLNYVLIGYVLKNTRHNFTQIKYTNRGYVAAVASAIFFVGSLYFEHSYNPDFHLELVSYAGCASLFICVFLVDAVERIFDNRLAIYLGRISFELYVCHIVFLVWFRRIPLPWLVRQNEWVHVVMIVLTSFVWTITVQTRIHRTTDVAAKRIARFFYV
jgi:peptidoglycan/LPS O-acetylase OafA/YrhL